MHLNLQFVSSIAGARIVELQTSAQVKLRLLMERINMAICLLEEEGLWRNGVGVFWPHVPLPLESLWFEAKLDFPPLICIL